MRCDEDIHLVDCQLKSSRLQAVRRNRFIVAIAMGTVLATTSLVLIEGSVTSAANVTKPSTHVQLGARLTDTTLGTGTQIETVDMLSSSLGFAVAAPANAGRGRFYLVRTTDLGNSWTVRGVLPLPSFVGPYGAGNEPAIHFVSAKVGYASMQNGPLYVTDAGGTTWFKVLIPGIWPTYVISGTTMSVVSDECKSPAPIYGPAKCPSFLSQFRIGTTTPIRTVAIPAAGPAGKWRAATALATVSPSSVVVSEGGNEGQHSSLLFTTDAGAKWRLLSDPCQEMMVDQLLTAIPSRWLLYCFMDGGMTQGTSKLWSSSNRGGSWSLVAHASQQGDDVGRIGDVSNTLYFNNQASTLYGALGGAAGGLEYSTDAGAHWAMTKIATSWYGGAPEYLSTFAATGAVFGVQNGPLYRTTNGTRWTELPPLPAGSYRGLSICTSKSGTQVSRSRTMTGIPGTTLDYPVVFTNDGATACYLNGIPNVESVSGLKRLSTGQLAYPEGVTGRGGFVVLKAHGGEASIVFESDADVGNVRSYCAPVTMHGISVRFAPPSAFFIPIPARPVCTGVSTIRNGGVVRGVVTWL